MFAIARCGRRQISWFSSDGIWVDCWLMLSKAHLQQRRQRRPLLSLLVLPPTAPTTASTTVTKWEGKQQ